MKSTALLAICFFVISFEALGNAPRDLVSTYDLRTYHPENYSLKDLVFEVRIDDLVDRLKKQLTLKNLDDVYFKVYWLFPGKYSIHVMGLPRGLTQIEKELKTLIEPRLDFVIPELLGPKLRSYNMTAMRQGKGMFVKAVDPSQSNAINEMHLTFDGGGQLKQLKTLSPAGVSVAKMKMNAKGWSHNKWVIEELDIKTILGVQVTNMRHEITYDKFSGYGFPSQVKTIMKQELLNSSGVKGEENKRVFESVMKFDNYEINTGKARKQFLSSSKK